MKKILFVSHQASLTGAPRSLLRFLQWFKENSDIPFVCLLRTSGPIQDEFKDLSSVLFFNKEEIGQREIIKVITRILGISTIRNKLHKARLKKRLSSENIGLIYANTVDNAQILEYLTGFLDCPVICHVRELEWVIRFSAIGLEGFEKVKKHTHQYIAISKIVKKNLIANHQIPANRVKVIYNGIQIDEKTQEYSQTIRRNLDISNDAFVICSSGVVYWRKGTDLFIQLAQAILSQVTVIPVHFLWVGGPTEGIYFSQLDYDLEQLDIKKYFHFTGSVQNPLDYFAACDIFALLSREEPFGMVCIEAAQLGKPVVCFEGTGITEFVGSDCGFIIPYLDIQAMANKIINLINAPELRQSLGQRARQKVIERHDINTVGPKVLEIIKERYSQVL